MDAAVRSWAPVEPICLKWNYPLWNSIDGLDPSLLKKEKPSRPSREKSPAKVELTAEEFVERFIGSENAARGKVLAAAQASGLSQRRSEALLKEAEGRNLVRKHNNGSNQPTSFSKAVAKGEIWTGDKE